MSGTPAAPTRRMSIGGANKGMSTGNSPNGALQRRLSIGNSKAASQSAMLVAAMSGLESDDASKAAFDGIGKLAPVKSDIEVLRLQMKHTISHRYQCLRNYCQLSNCCWLLYFLWISQFHYSHLTTGWSI